ncbi:flavin reductase family protein [Azoarcus indigens]|uniref:Flavin reductase (DIM6/NTAB) family NADH-FMN oxidoreductase RutF n=1 Tax=Azoarcus indigens TaxID=29545 RepID=A0A4R6DST6_9RHOO|nr:flavin reductase family protein [Azoarcus indigens]NMG67027.1 flavin reductase family protein [Azoarcus indigens]TDN48185.1 flavin reductase (DIM6/NTAB) family NADH-FMN oxidoreductase RutF [Azoarcus indigens]
MQISLDRLTEKQRYGLLTSLVVPRPIAWVTTVSPEGTVNAAPFSFFNLMGHDPAVVALGILAHPEKPLKDTARNIERSGEFVVNLVDEHLAAAMNATAVDLAYGSSELALVGLETAPGLAVEVPRITACSASLECRLLQSIPVSEHQRVMLGQVVALHVDDALVQDAERGHVHIALHAPIARMGGAGIYARSSDRFELERPDAATQPLER